MLREEGERVKQIIEDIKPSMVGDLSISIDANLNELIRQLEESEDEKLQTKAQHIKALFRELAYGEEYDGSFLGEQEAPEGYEFATGVPLSGTRTFSFPNVGGSIAVSGVLPQQPILSGLPPSQSQPHQPMLPFPTNPCGEKPLGESAEDIAKAYEQQRIRDEEAARAEEMMEENEDIFKEVLDL